MAHPARHRVSSRSRCTRHRRLRCKSGGTVTLGAMPSSTTSSRQWLQSCRSRQPGSRRNRHSEHHHFAASPCGPMRCSDRYSGLLPSRRVVFPCNCRNGCGSRQFETRIALYVAAKEATSSLVVPCTPPPETRPGAPPGDPPIAEGHEPPDASTAARRAAVLPPPPPPPLRVPGTTTTGTGTGFCARCS